MAELVNDEMERIMKLSWPKALSHNFPQDQVQPQNMKNSQCPNQDFNKAPPKYNTTTANYLVL
jgi:hypothetical protein